MGGKASHNASVSGMLGKKEREGVARLFVSRTAVTQREWEDLARLDPLWTVLSDNRKQFGKWDREEFFPSGQREIDVLMSSCGFAAEITAECSISAVA